MEILEGDVPGRLATVLRLCKHCALCKDCGATMGIEIARGDHDDG